MLSQTYFSFKSLYWIFESLINFVMSKSGSNNQTCGFHEHCEIDAKLTLLKYIFQDVFRLKIIKLLKLLITSFF